MHVSLLQQVWLLKSHKASQQRHSAYSSEEKRQEKRREDYAFRHLMRSQVVYWAAQVNILVIEHVYPITSTFGLTEDQYLAAIHLLLKQLGQLGVLFILLEEDELLSNPVVGLELCGTNHDSVGVLQEVSSYRFYLLGPGGAPKQRLPVWSDLLQAQLCVSN